MARNPRGRKRQRSDDQPSSNSDSDGSRSDVEITGTAPEPTQPPPAGPTTAAPATDKERKKAAFAKAWDTDVNTPEQVLEKQKKTWKTPTYAHFKDPEILEDKGELKYRFRCKKHPNEIVMRVRWDSSTSNLARHVAKCEGRSPSDTQPINEFAYGSTYSKARMRFLLAKWIAVRHRPYIIVEDPELVAIFRMLYAKVEVPSAVTLSRDIQEIFVISRQNLALMLEKYSGKYHVCIDGWTAPNVLSFLGVTAQRVVEGKIERFILDFIKLSKGHSGEYLATKLAACLREYRIADKILGVVADNASNNSTLVEELERLLNGANSAQSKIDCIAHVWNLVVKAMIAPFAATRSASKAAVSVASKDTDSEVVAVIDDELEGLLDESDISETSGDAEVDEDGEFELDADREAYDTRTIEAVIQEVEAEGAMTESERRVARFAVTKLTELAKRVFHSPAIREDLAASCIKVKIEPKEMVRSVATRWNSLAEAIARALYLRFALDKLLSIPKYDKAGPKGLRRFKLTFEEWEILTQLYPLLKIFLQATQRVLQGGIPLLHEVIPLIDILTGHLEDAAEDKAGLLHITVRHAAARGLKVLNKYYQKTDKSIMYRCAMILHPKYKLSYFRNNEWLPSWIKTAEELLRDHWEAHYKPQLATRASKRAEASSSHSTLDDSDDIFATIDNYGMEDVDDPIKVYLESSPEPVTDPIMYWTSRLGSSPLAQMALDFLSAPAASVDVERAFSSGGLMVSKRRHALSDQSVRAATVLGSWASHDGFIPEAHVLDVLKNKSRRVKITSVTNVHDDSSDVELVE